MRRREFITLLGSAATGWPLAARAQQPDRVRHHIGVFVGNASSADDPIAGETLRQFREAMQQAGWTEGKNIRVDYRFGGERAKINASAAELVAHVPELIYAHGLPAAPPTAPLDATFYVTAKSWRLR